MDEGKKAFEALEQQRLDEAYAKKRAVRNDAVQKKRAAKWDEGCEAHEYLEQSRLGYLDHDNGKGAFFSNDVLHDDKLIEMPRGSGPSKVCTNCNVERHVSQFNRCSFKYSSDGRQPWCRQCHIDRYDKAEKMLSGRVAPQPRTYTLMRSTGLKICTKCRLPKTGDEFYKNKAQIDGLQNQCKQCAKEARQAKAKKASDEKRAGEVECATCGKQKPKDQCLLVSGEVRCGVCFSRYGYGATGL